MNTIEDNVPHNFILVDLMVDESFKEIPELATLPVTYLIGVSKENYPVGISAAFEPYSMLSDSGVLRVLSEYDNWGIVCHGQMWAVPTDGTQQEFAGTYNAEQEGLPENAYKTFLFFAIWDGELVSSVRIIPPDGVTDEETEDGMPYNKPIYSTGKTAGALSDALKFAHMMSRR